MLSHCRLGVVRGRLAAPSHPGGPRPSLSRGRPWAALRHSGWPRAGREQRALKRAPGLSPPPRAGSKDAERFGETQGPEPSVQLWPGLPPRGCGGRDVAARPLAAWGQCTCSPSSAPSVPQTRVALLPQGVVGAVLGARPQETHLHLLLHLRHLPLQGAALLLGNSRAERGAPMLPPSNPPRGAGAPGPASRL